MLPRITNPNRVFHMLSHIYLIPQLLYEKDIRNS